VPSFSYISEMHTKILSPPQAQLRSLAEDHQNRNIEKHYKQHTHHPHSRAKH
jgi:hypothetical protein